MSNFKNKIITATDGEFSFVENSPIIKILRSPTGMFKNRLTGEIHSGVIALRRHYFNKEFQFLPVPTLDSEDDWEVYYE